MFSKFKYAFFKNRLTTPIYLIFFVTSRCNAKCRHCFFHKALNDVERDLSLAEIENFSTSLGKLLWLNYSGGEPFIREDLYETYEIFAKNNAVENIAIPTNGILTEKIYADVEKMLRDGRFKTLTINLSLDGPQDVHDETRGIACYEKVFQTYEALASLKRSYKKLSLMIATVITRRNCRVLNAFHREVIRTMPGIDYHNFEIARGTPPDRAFGAPSADRLREIREVLFAIWDHYDYYDSFWKARIANRAKKLLYDQAVNILETGKQPWPCLAGRVHAVVDYKGKVSVCELLPGLGSLRKQSFADIWHSRQAQMTRASIDRGECACHHACFQTTSLLFNQRYWPRLLL